MRVEIRYISFWGHIFSIFPVGHGVSFLHLAQTFWDTGYRIEAIDYYQ
jgi:hypothetical protein